MLHRRDFFPQAAGLAAAARLLPAQDDQFDSLPAAVWRNARSNGLVMIHQVTIHDLAPALLSSRTQIAPDDEPGDRLVVEGQVFAPDGHTPAPGVTVYAYNTDRQGYYGENRKEYPPRIYGWMKTGPAGRFELYTIRPGNYPGLQAPAHIHFELWGAGYPLQWAEDLKIAGDRFLTPDAVASDIQLGDFRTIQPLTRAKDNLLHCAFQIRLRPTTNFA
jgi:protocatechuate 3,4-dioxygenase beta subunit